VGDGLGVGVGLGVFSGEGVFRCSGVSLSAALTCGTNFKVRNATPFSIAKKRILRSKRELKKSLDFIG
jgi:hypothetical protein